MSLPGESFWKTASLEAMQQELQRANRERDEAYAKARIAEKEAKEAHWFARLTEDRVNYWKKERKLSE